MRQGESRLNIIIITIIIIIIIRISAIARYSGLSERCSWRCDAVYIGIQ